MTGRQALIQIVRDYMLQNNPLDQADLRVWECIEGAVHAARASSPYSYAVLFYSAATRQAIVQYWDSPALADPDGPAATRLVHAIQAAVQARLLHDTGLDRLTNPS